MTKETKVGLVIGLLFMVGVVYVLSLFTQPSEFEQQVEQYRDQHKPIVLQPTNTQRIPLSAVNNVEPTRVKVPSTVFRIETAPVVPARVAEAPVIKTIVVPVAPKPRFYVVKEGQTLTDIALKFYKAAGENELQKIHKANKYKMSNRDIIWPGLKLLIPPLHESKSGTIEPAKTEKLLSLGRSRTYTVMPGDTLSEISSKKLGTVKRWREIRQLNSDKLPSEHTPLQVGMVLKLPVVSKGSGARLPKGPDDLWQ